MKTIKKLKNKISQGSVLVFTLIVLFIILTAAISIAAITVIERKTSTSTGKSIAGFQTADSGTEIFLKKIQGQSGPLSGISGLNCSGNSVSGTAGSGTYTITFYDSAEPPQQLDCNADLASIDHIRSVGTSSGTTRAVEVAVAQAGSGPGSWTCRVVSAITNCKCTAPEKIIFGTCQNTINSAVFDFGSEVYGMSCEAGKSAWCFCCQ